MLRQILQQFQDYFSNNQFFENDFAVAGVISAIVYGCLRAFQGFFKFLSRRIERLFIYNVTIEQSDELYTLVSKLISDQYPNKLRRVEAFLSERHGDSWQASRYNTDDNIKLRHYSDFIIIRRGFTFIKVQKEREKLENAENFTTAFMGRISLSGFLAKRQINNLLEEALNYIIRDDAESLKRYFFEDNYWQSDLIRTNKQVSKIFFPEKEDILKRIDQFSASKELYISRGIEWYFGLLLHGKPGSGKTSFGKALAKHTGRVLYTLSLGGITDNDFKVAFGSMGANALLLLDDVDICINGRDDKEAKGVKLNTLLSCLDGTDSRSDLIVVMTTNRIEVLDDALTRKGRVDLIQEVSYPDSASIHQFVTNFYDVDMIPPITLNTFDFSMAEVQDICLRQALAEQAVAAINQLQLRENTQDKVKDNGMNVFVTIE